MSIKKLFITIILFGVSDLSAQYSLDDYDKLRNSCLSGKGKHCFVLSELFLIGNSDNRPDKYESVKYSKLSCKRNYGKGCFILASGYVSGEALPRSKHSADKYFKKACTLEYKKACTKYPSK